MRSQISRRAPSSTASTAGGTCPSSLFLIISRALATVIWLGGMWFGEVLLPMMFNINGIDDRISWRNTSAKKEEVALKWSV